MSLVHYYRLHAGIYDLTRWSFLFGRRKLVEDAVFVHRPESVLEIGCGTGTNLRRLGRKLPEAELVGIDLSEDMLRRAERKLAPFRARVRLVRGRYPDDSRLLGSEHRFDLILFSYSLSMFGGEWGPALEAAQRSLSSRGVVAVLDFHEFQLPRVQALDAVEPRAARLPAPASSESELDAPRLQRPSRALRILVVLFVPRRQPADAGPLPSHARPRPECSAGSSDPAPSQFEICLPWFRQPTSPLFRDLLQQP